MPTPLRTWPRPSWMLAVLASLLLGLTPLRASHAQVAGAVQGSVWGSPAGVDPCASEDLLARRLAADPALRERQEVFERLVREAERQRLIPSREARLHSTTSSPTYVIPVVVHIVASLPSAIEDISDNQVLSQIYALNRDFANTPGNPAPAVNTGIAFCLAPGLPANSTVSFPGAPGITRDYNATLTNHIYGNQASEAALKALSYLPSAQYLNIWVVKSITPIGIAGYGTFPASGPPAVDGIVMRYDCFGSNNTPYGGPWNLLASNNDGKILTHEAGHYLNLLHTFHNGCAPPGDQVSDTPPEQVNHSGCPAPSTSCTSAFDPIENYMDYTNDACRFAFTAGQTLRMQTAITQYRSMLVSAASLVQAACSPGLNALIDAQPTQVCAGGSVQFTTPASGAGWTYSWSFPGGTPASANVQSLSVTYPSAGAWPVTLTVTDGGSNSNTTYATIYVTSCTPIQNRCSNWTFASHAAVSFATGVPVAFTGTQGNSAEAAATLSSPSGALLFYSDGDRVLDATHTVMPNGNGIFAGGSAHNGVLALPRPGSSTQDLLFQVRMFESYPTTNLISYSVIDMTLHSGLGDIPSGQKNIPITLPGNPDGMLEALALIPNCNGTDWWLISEGATGSVAKVFVTPITAAGPGVSTAYPPSGGGHGLNPGAIVPSADGTMFVTVATASADITVYDFNRATGAVAVHTPSTNLGAYTDAVLSPNKHLVYYNYHLNNVFGVRQLDLATLTWREIWNGNYSAIKPGPDGKIYIAGATENGLHVINYPDNFNTNDQNECGLNLFGISFPYPMTNSIFGALPNMVQSCTNATPPAQFTYTVTNCLTAHFTSANCGGPYTWNFGDSQGGSGQSVSHTYAGPGTYTVTLTVPAASPTVATQTLTIGMQPVTIAGSNTACANPNNYSAIGPSNYTYQWQVFAGTPASGSGNNIDVVWNATGGSITLTATDPTTGCTTVLTKYVGPCPTCFKPPLGMCAWWPLDEPANSSAIETVLGNHGVDINAPAHVPGQVRRGRQFNGTSSYVQVNDAPGINFGTGDLSIDAWVKTTSATGVQRIVDKRFADPEVGYALYLRSGRLAFRLADPSNTSGSEYWTATTPFVADGQWHHVAASEQRSDLSTGTRLYVDGSVVASFPGYSASGNITTSEKLWIGAGATTSGPGTFFDGVIDEVELFQRALTTADVLGIVQADTLGKCKEFAYVPAVASFCRDQNDITLTMQVCNHTTATQTYNLVFTGLSSGCTWSGPTTIQILSPNPVTVPPNTCVPVTYKVFRPAGMPLYSTTCYQVTMTNLATSYSTIAQGKITAARQWCFLPIRKIETAWGNTGSNATLRFVMTNTSEGPSSTPFQVRVVPADAWAGETPGISLNGVAPGAPFVGVANAATGDSVALDVVAHFTEERPFRAYQVELVMDEDNDGSEDAASSGVLRYAADSVTTVSVPVAPASPRITSLWVAPNPVRDRTMVRYTLAARGDLEIALYDIAGRRIRTFLTGSREAGPGSIVADCSGLPRGVYLVRMRTEGTVAAQRLVILR